MNKIFSTLYIFLLFTSSIFAADEIDKKKMFDEQTEFFLNEYNNFFSKNEILNLLYGELYLRPCQLDTSKDTNCMAVEQWQDTNFTYAGTIKNGKLHGLGEIIDSNNKTAIIGTFRNGKLNGKAKVFLQGTDDYFLTFFENNVFASGKKRYFQKSGNSFIEREDVWCSMDTSISCKSKIFSTSSSSSSLSGYEHCRNVWGKLINIRDKYSKNTPDYYRLDALVQTAFDLWTAYKGTNAKDTGNCDRLLSLGNN